MDTATEARIVEIIDRALTDVSHDRPVRTDVVDVLLDVRLRVLELAALDWIESEQGLAAGSTRVKGGGLVGAKRRSP